MQARALRSAANSTAFCDCRRSGVNSEAVEERFGLGAEADDVEAVLGIKGIDAEFEELCGLVQFFRRPWSRWLVSMTKTTSLGWGLVSLLRVGDGHEYEVAFLVGIGPVGEEADADGGGLVADEEVEVGVRADVFGSRSRRWRS